MNGLGKPDQGVFELSLQNQGGRSTGVGFDEFVVMCQSKLKVFEGQPNLIWLEVSLTSLHQNFDLPWIKLQRVREIADGIEIVVS